MSEQRKEKAITPREKWDRLQSPKTYQDYCLSLNKTELLQIPEGRALLAQIEEECTPPPFVDTCIRNAVRLERDTMIDVLTHRSAAKARTD